MEHVINYIPTANMELGESVNDWATRVQSLAGNCGFKNELNFILCDKFVTGMIAGPIQDRLFEEDAAKVQWSKLLEIANNNETTLRHRQELYGASASGESGYSN